MAIEQSRDGRARAWVLIQANPDVAERLYEALGHEGGDEYVVVRADVVDYHYNVVVPVDAANEDLLSMAVDKIQEIEGVGETVVIRVTQHNPRTPNRAHGYISEEEAEEYPPEEGGFPPGRLSRSPGANAWG
jgi:hypothetical protein